MPQPCTVCSHAQRREIDGSLCVGNASVRAVARAHHLSEAAVRRHKGSHLVRTLATAREAPEAAQADDLLRHLRALQSKTYAVLLNAEKDGDGRLVLAAVREARENVALLGKLLGEIDDRPVVNLVLSGEWLDLRAEILAALQPFPEARLALVEALSGAAG